MIEQHARYAPSRRWSHRALTAIGVAAALALPTASDAVEAQTAEANESETQRYDLYEIIVRDGVESADGCSGQSNPHFAFEEGVVEFDGTTLASPGGFRVGVTTYNEWDEHESLRYRTNPELDHLDIAIDDDGAIVDSSVTGSYWVESRYNNFDEGLVEKTLSETRVIDSVSSFSQGGNKLYVRLTASDDHCPTSAKDVVILILREENPSPPGPPVADPGPPSGPGPRL